ncbi:hypothetical protein [Kocuria sabuli]|uniref:hypothetical protein n=1 Tax=Kocuria sabuli TaxID=3071448 RepID=UPI0034D3B554
MPVPAARRLALAAAPAVLACALALPPAAAAGTPEVPVAVRAELGPAPAVGDPREVGELVPASRVTAGTRSSLLDRGQGPLLAVGGAVVALMGAFVAGLSRRPEPVD